MDLTKQLRLAHKCSGKSMMHIIFEALSLRYGPGRLGLAEYLDYSLFDDSKYDAEQKRSFAGWRLQRYIDELTPRDWWSVIEDKVVLGLYLRGLGFPTPDIMAVYAESRRFNKIKTLKNRDDLLKYLVRDAVFPLFGKPVRQGHGIDAMSLIRHVDNGSIQLGNGEIESCESITARIVQYSSKGYLFQELLRPHPDTVIVCGDRLTSLRMTVMMDQDVPNLLFSQWKVPVGRNMVDNTGMYNIVAPVDLPSGLIAMAYLVDQQGQSQIKTHPDVGVSLEGFVIPDFSEACELCLKAARSLPDIAVQGWDVAITDAGPVLIETNVTGDIDKIQHTFGTGFLIPETRRLLK